MRFSVTLRIQSALFRRVRLSSPGQTQRRLAEKRILELVPHEEAHPGVGTSWKGAVWVVWGLQSVLFRETSVAECAFP